MTRSLRVLIVTTEWPRFAGDLSGIHVVNQVRCLRQLGLRIDVFSFRGQKQPLAYYRACHELSKTDLRQYDVIHAHHGQSGIVALTQNERPVVVTFHGSDLQGMRDRRGHVTAMGYVLRFTSRWVARRAARVILVSERLAHILPKDVCYRVIPAGIDLNLFQPMSAALARAELSLPIGTKLVLFVGNPKRAEKRFWLAKKAVERLNQQLPVNLVIADAVPSTQMPLYMHACDALVVTSSSEGSPNTVKEALACNLPVVSTDVGDVRERIGAIEGCVVCENDRPEAIAAGLVEVLSRSQRIRGRQSVRGLTERLLAKQVVQTYREVVGEQNSRSGGRNVVSA